MVKSLWDRQPYFHKEKRNKKTCFIPNASHVEITSLKLVKNDQFFFHANYRILVY